MIKIRKDKIEKIVTLGAYEEMYQAMGYELVVEPKEKNAKNNTSTKVEANELAEEKPNVQRYAEEKANAKSSKGEE